MLRRYYLLIVGLLGLLLASCGGMRRARQAPQKPTAVIVDTIAPGVDTSDVVVVEGGGRVARDTLGPGVGGEETEGESTGEDPSPSDLLVGVISELACASTRVEVARLAVPSGRGGRMTQRQTSTMLEGVAVTVTWTGAFGTYDVATRPVRSDETGQRALFTFAVEGASSSGTTPVLSLECPASDAGKVAGWFDGEATGLFDDQIAQLEGHGWMDLDNLFGRVSDCVVERLSAEQRLRLLSYLVDRDWVPTDNYEERQVARLLREVPDGQVSATVGVLNGKGSYQEFFEAIDDPEVFGEVTAALMSLFHREAPGYVPVDGECSAADGLSKVVTGGVATNMFSPGPYKYVRYGPGEITVSTVESTYRAQGSSSAPGGGWDLTVTDRETAAPFEPVILYVGPGHTDVGLAADQYLGAVPMIVAAGLAEKRDADMNTSRAWTGVNVALLAFGVGESVAAYRAYPAARTGLALARLSLAVADVATVAADAACAQGESELCREWQRVSGYVALGLISAQSVDGLRSLMYRSRNLTDETGEVIFKDVEDLAGVPAGRVGLATEAITRARLPEEFVAALRGMGQSEDEIVAYFTKYDNDHGRRFLNEVEEMARRYPNLTREEAYAVWGYTTNLFYGNLNTWLRTGQNVEKTAAMKRLLTAAIQKLPRYEGKAFRAIKLDGSALEGFLAKHTSGAPVNYGEFVSSGSTREAAFFDKPEKNILLEMEISESYIISDFADGIKFRGYALDELLTPPGAKFDVRSVVEEDSKVLIRMNQIE